MFEQVSFVAFPLPSKGPPTEACDPMQICILWEGLKP